MYKNILHYLLLIPLFAFSTAHFYLLDGRAPNYEAMRYIIGDSYYYSKLLCTPDFVNIHVNTTLGLRNSS